LKKVLFNPKSIDDRIKEERAAIRIIGGTALMNNIKVFDSDVGISTTNTNLYLNQYYSIGSRKPLKINGGQNIDLRNLFFKRRAI
jgi:hypothetical protein